MKYDVMFIVSTSGKQVIKYQHATGDRDPSGFYTGASVGPRITWRKVNVIVIILSKTHPLLLSRFLFFFLNYVGFF